MPSFQYKMVRTLFRAIGVNKMLDNIEAYDGIHSLFVHAGLDDTHFVKVAYHVP